MIPQKEMERLLVAAVTASALAQSGQKQVGYEWLQAGLLLAVESQSEEEEWPALLARRWQLVLDAYCAEFDPDLASMRKDSPQRERVPV